MQSANFDTVILLHCSASSSRQWTRLIADAPHLPLKAIDLHGYGSTQKSAVQPEVPYSLDRQVELVEAAMAGARSVALIGHSFGGAVALVAAARFRDRIGAVVAHEPVLFSLLEKNGESALYSEVCAMQSRMQGLVAGGHPAEAAQLFVDHWDAPGKFAALKPYRQAKLASLAGKIVLDFEALLGSPDDLQFFAGLPALITYGEKSREPGIRVAQLLGALYGGPVVIPGAGHMAPVTHPEYFNKIALSYLRTGIAANPA